MLNWSLQTRKLSDLKDHPKNPRKLTKDQEAHLRASLDKFGLVDKIIVNTDGTIIGGHQRKKTLRKMGLKDVECLIPERPLSEKEVEELGIKLNRIHGSFDYEILANEYQVEDLLDWGFTSEELFDAPLSSIDEEEEQHTKKKSKSCPHCGKEID